MSKNIKEKQYFQNLFIKLSNGTEIHASVPAFAFEQKDVENISIVEIKITKPKELPKGTSFEIIK